jgi:hypothetical protein
MPLPEQYYRFVMDYAPYLYVKPDEGADLTWGKAAFAAGFAVDFLYEAYFEPQFDSQSNEIETKIVELTDWILTQQVTDSSKHAYGGFASAENSQIYTIGKGPSTMTIEAPKTSIELGKSLVISGTVTDISAGTKQAEQTARFPNGVAAVSDASMSQWMEYVYQQKPKPTNTTGVPVTLSVIDSNGNYRTIGTTTSDSDGYFTYQWKPDIEGQYRVYATFAGSESYYGSHAETSFAVDPTAATPAPTQTPATPIAEQYFSPAIAGLFIAIIAVGLLTILSLKKKP